MNRTWGRGWRVAALLGFLIGQAAASAAGAEPDAPATMAQFIRMRWPTSAAPAPDGSLYVVYNPEGTYQLYRMPAGGGALKKLTERPDGISGYSLSDDGKWIVVSAGTGGNEQDDLYLLDTATDQLTPILVDSETVFGSVVWRRDSQAFAYRANKESKRDFHIYLYDLATRTSKPVLARSGHHAPADFNRAGDRLVVQKYNSSTHSQLFEVNLADGSVREISPQDEAWSFDPVGYTADEKSFIVATDFRGDLSNLRSIDLATGAIAPLAPEFDRHEVDGAAFNEERTLLAILLNEDGYRTLHLYDLAERKPHPGPAIPQGLVGNVDFRGDRMIFSLDNANTPGVIYRWSPTTPQAAPVALTQPDTQGLDLAGFSLPKLVRYRSFDGLEIPAFLYTPAGYRAGTPIPFVLSFHGGPESQYRPALSRPFQYFLSRGFGVLAPNVRGSSGYGKKYLELDNYQRRMDSVRDGVAAARWLVENKYSQPGAIGLYGGSYGGFMVVAVAAEAPKLFGAVCDVVGIVNFRTFLERTADYRRTQREAEYGPLSDPEFLESISPIRLVQNIDAPLLIAHGRNDPRVPLHEAEQLHAELKRLDRPVELLVFDDEGHGFRKEVNQITFYERLADFFEKHLQVTRPEPAGSTQSTQ